MSANPSGEQMIKAWAESQRQLLTNWMDKVRAGGGAPDTKIWNETVDSWRTAVMNTLDTQATWTRTWIDSMAKTPGAPDEMRALLREGQDNFQHWIDAQRQLWQNWFDVMRETTKGAARGKASADQPGEGLVDMWSSTTRSLLDAQTEWVRRWSDAFGGGKH
jgi:hypothetical protein